MLASSHPPRQTCLPATLRSVSRRRTHRERSAACGSCGWVLPSGRKQNWLGPAGAALCPLIRRFRQGGGRCGYSSPAHSGGAWPGRASRALSPQPQGFQGSPSVRPACLHLDEGFRAAPPAKVFSPRLGLQQVPQAPGPNTRQGAGSSPCETSGQGRTLWAEQAKEA